MEGFIDKLAELWKSLFGSSGTSGTGSEPGGTSEWSSSDEEARARAGSRDADYQEAWEELDEYMRTGSNKDRQTADRGGPGGSERHGQGHGQRPGPRPVDESLRRDYANLEVPFGADIEKVRNSYKRLMLKYHPDRNAGSPEKQAMALEISKKINESFERIRARQESGR